MTLLLLWKQPFLPIQTSVRVNKRLDLQQVGGREGVSLTDLSQGFCRDLAWARHRWGLEFFHTSLSGRRLQGHLYVKQALVLLSSAPSASECFVSLIGVAEQFAIAEAKLRAWSSVDGDDSTDESYDEDFPGGADAGEEHFARCPLGVSLPGRCGDSL